MELGKIKKELRKEKIMARESLSEEARVRYSEDICGRVAGTPEYSEAKTIFVYKWVKGEVKLDALEKLAAADGKRLVYPLCVSRTEMVAVEPDGGEDAWVDSGFQGIMEPDPEKGSVIDPADIDLIVAPCSSFDEECNRLGMGGGFYDRFLPKCVSAVVMAAAFEAQKSDKIPADQHDRPVDAVVTEARVYTQKQVRTAEPECVPGR